MAKNIFDDKKLYPSDEPFKSHFQGTYDSVFVAFNPFFTIEGNRHDVTSFQKSIQKSAAQSIAEDDLPKELINTTGTVFAPNKDYPSDQIIRDKGIVVPWQNVALESGLGRIEDVYQALKTSIGAYNKKFARPELAQKLDTYTNARKIWHPSEGRFDALSLIAIQKTFIKLGKSEICFMSEHYDENATVVLNAEEAPKPFETFRFNFIYSADKAILFAIDWDSFFS